MNTGDYRGLIMELLAGYYTSRDGEDDATFNPYADICRVYDKAGAQQVRQDNLIRVLAIMRPPIDSLWVGRDLGWRGGRRTGIALTDEANLMVASNHWQVELTQATHNEPMREATATTVWSVLADAADRNTFLWNVFPFHPYSAFADGYGRTNRRHNRAEGEFGARVLTLVVQMLRPKRIVAMGNDAYSVCGKLFPDDEVVKFRHPSYGGTTIFRDQAAAFYGLARLARPSPQECLF